MSESTALVHVPRERWYRVESSSAYRDIVIAECFVMSRTACGVWLELPYGGGKRFVLTAARKRYACPTIDEAIDSFLARKRRQLSILRAQVQTIDAAVATINEQRNELKARKYLHVPRTLDSW